MKPPFRLFLDDKRDPSEVTWVQLPLGPWVVCRSYDEFVKTITEQGVPDFISFDHDLADEHYRPSMFDPDRHYSQYYTDGTFKEKTGYECVKWLCDLCLVHEIPFPAYAVHTMNPVGAENIHTMIRSFVRFRARDLPTPEMRKHFHLE